MSLNEWTLLASSLFWAELLLLAVTQWRPNLRPLLRGYLISLGAVAVIACAGLAASYQSARQSEAIIVIRDAIAHNGPFDESPTAFTLHDGAELAIIDRKNDWLQVSPDPRRIGWVRQDQVLLSSATSHY